jgi:hypothetical protein
MPKSKLATKRKSKPPKPTALKKKIIKPRAPVKVKLPQEPVYSAEYREYLQRYALAGADRPRLSSKEFDELDDELLDLLALESDLGLDDEQIIRLQELEYLLLDAEQ